MSHDISDEQAGIPLMKSPEGTEKKLADVHRSRESPPGRDLLPEPIPLSGPKSVTQVASEDQRRREAKLATKEVQQRLQKRLQAERDRTGGMFWWVARGLFASLVLGSWLGRFIAVDSSDSLARRD